MIKVFGRKIIPKLATMSIFLFATFLFLATRAEAHVLDYGAMKTELIVRENKIVMQLEAPQNISYASYYDSSKSEFEMFQDDFSNRFLIRQNDKECAFNLLSFDNVNNPDKSVFDGEFVCPKSIVGVEELSINNSIFKQEFKNFDNFVTLTIGKSQWELIFNNDLMDYPSQISAKYLGTIFDRFFIVSGQFIWLGMKHIFSGYDHILFLLLIILLTRSFRSILLLVTSFTIAHSITLILAGLEIVRLSPRVVEPLIAVTILYVAIRNIMTLHKEDIEDRENIQKDKKKTNKIESWLTVFCFGLIHGLGFASVLAETSIPKLFFVPSLIIFNVGIEVGQLLILLLIIPVLFLIDRSTHKNKVFKTISIAVAAVAIFWFFDRL